MQAKTAALAVKSKTHSRTTPVQAKQPQGLKNEAAKALGLQPGLKTGKPQDPYERQADHLADRTVAGEQALGDKVTLLKPQLEETPQRQSQPEEEEESLQAQTEEEEELQAKQEEEEETVQAQVDDEEENVQAQPKREEEEDEYAPGDLQAKAVEGRRTGIGPGTAFRRARSRSGSPLENRVRDRLEAAFNRDFDGVRIHTDDAAVVLNREFGARALTAGDDIFFNRGEYNPETRQGLHLLAHEATHTLQQRQAEGVEAPSRTQKLQPKIDANTDSYQIRPELLEAVAHARSQIGSVNAKLQDAEGNRQGWERIRTYFDIAFGGKMPIHPDVIRRIKTYTDKNGQVKDMLPHWCGIFVWWSLKSAGVPVPDWKLGWTSSKFLQARSKGEIPQKGDIAYRHKNNHFAIVSGVDFSGPGGSARIATINGNTAGQDNLGGQIEEQFDPLSGWDVFYDTLAKLDMPEVPLVNTGIETDELVTTPDSTDEEKEPASEEEGEQPVPTDTSATETETTPVTESANSEVALELPEIPAAPPHEPVAAVDPLALQGSSDQMVTEVAAASPSQVALSGDKLGGAVSSKLKAEQKQQQDNPQELTVNLAGNVQEGITPAEQLMPGQAKIPDSKVDAGPKTLTPETHENRGQAPSNRANVDRMEKKSLLGGFFDWLKANFSRLVNGLPTSDNNLNTSAGSRQRVDLSGTADPSRMAEQRSEAGGALRGKRDELTGQLQRNPGQANIKAKSVQKKQRVERKPEPQEPVTTEPAQAAQDYAAASLPEEVRKKADEKLSLTLGPKLNKAQTDTDQAVSSREQDEQQAIADAERETASLNQQADAEQRRIVIDNRGKVAGKQKQGIEQAYGEVNSFEKQAATQQNSGNATIRTKVSGAESQADKRLGEAETFAASEKARGDREASAIKADLKRKEQDKGWWDRAVDFIKDAVKKATKLIDDTFNAIRKGVAKVINAAKKFAVDTINAARNAVVGALNSFRDWAKSQVTTYLGSTFPGLARTINGAIDTVVDTAVAGVNLVADGAIAAVEVLAAGLASLLDKILAAFQTALKAAVQIIGAVITGDFVEALKIAIRAACEIAGINPQPIFDFFERAGKQLLSILKNPVPFFNNLVKAIGMGVRSFVKNIKQHLIKGLVEWLTGALSSVPITLPKKFDLKGIVHLVLQVLGLTYENIKARIIKRYPKAAKVFSVIEKGVKIIRVLITKGVVGLWTLVKQTLGNLKELVLGAIRGFVITTVIKEAVTWLLGLLNPAGALVKVLKLLFDLVKFLVERFQQIKDFVLSVYGAVTSIAAGVLGKAAAAVENAMARSLPVVIGLLASLAGLGGIGATVQKIIKKVSKPINKVIDKVVDKVVKFAKKLIKKGKGAAKELKDKIVSWWKVKRKFTATNGEGHTLFFKGGGKSAKLTMRSKEQPYQQFLKDLDESSFTSEQKAHLKQAKKVAAQIDTKRKEAVGGKDKAEKAKNAKAKQDALDGMLLSLSDSTKHLFGEALPEWQEPSYGAANSAGFGTSMEIRVLSKNGEGWKQGSSPSQAAHGSYDVLNLRRQSGGASFYVRGHLLNDNLGGPGVWKNMTPLSRQGNHQHEAQVESYIKAGFNSKAVQRYKVVPTYSGQSKGPALKKAMADKHPAQADTFAKIIDAEQNVPTALSIESARIEKKGDKFVDKEKKSWTISNDIQRSADKYFLSDSPKIVPVAVNSLTSAQPLKEFKHPGISDEADAIYKAVKARRDQRGPMFGTYATLARETVDQGGSLSEAKAKQWNQDGYILLS
ncbi:eCIS core domain-containing protein [Marinobacterium sp. YM272]|uniref:eCIS core domain-containing protein n=1 Tax=Marinobacterium sp. YM272 TaxID=3421654 RepID=UPI003D7FBEBE